MYPTTTTQERRPQAPENNTQTTAQMISLADQKKKEIEDTVCQLYREAQEENPMASWHKLTVMVAAKTGYSPEGIKGMLKRNGITRENRD